MFHLWPQPKFYACLSFHTSFFNYEIVGAPKQWDISYVSSKNLISSGVLQHTFYKMHSSGTESNELNITLEHHNNHQHQQQHQVNPASSFTDHQRHHYVHPGMLQQPPSNEPPLFKPHLSILFKHNREFLRWTNFAFYNKLAAFISQTAGSECAKREVLEKVV